MYFLGAQETITFMAIKSLRVSSESLTGGIGWKAERGTISWLGVGKRMRYLGVTGMTLFLEIIPMPLVLRTIWMGAQETIF